MPDDFIRRMIQAVIESFPIDEDESIMYCTFVGGIRRNLTMVGDGDRMMSTEWSGREYLHRRHWITCRKERGAK